MKFILYKISFQSKYIFEEENLVDVFQFTFENDAHIFTHW